MKKYILLILAAIVVYGCSGDNTVDKGQQKGVVGAERKAKRGDE